MFTNIRNNNYYIFEQMFRERSIMKKYNTQGWIIYVPIHLYVVPIHYVRILKYIFLN